MSNAAKLILAALLAVALSACGGGGGSSTAPAPAGSGTGTGAPPAGPTASPPAGPTAADVALQLGPVPPTTYTGGRQAAYNQLNAIRIAGGQGYLKQNAQLDRAAQAHADYLAMNDLFGHDEIAGKPGFYAADPAARFLLAGFAASIYSTESGSEALSGGSAETCAAWLFSSGPHAALLLSAAREVGVGVARVPARLMDICVFNFGTSGTAYDQLPASTDAFAVAPNGAYGMDIRFPVAANLRTVATRNAIATDVRLTTAALADAAGNLVPASIIMAPGASAAPGIAASADTRMHPLGVALLPTATLVPGQRYTATISATVKGQALSRTWTFTTLGGSGYTQ